MRAWAALLVLLACCGVRSATVDVGASLATLDLAPRIEVLEDPGGTLGIEAVAASAGFAAPPAKGPNFGFTRSAWWVRFTLRNAGEGNVALLLRQDYPLIDWIDFYAPAEGGAWRTVRTGDRRNFSTREFGHRDFVFALDVPAHAERTYYLRFASSGPVDISLAL